jgi:choline dehydrogenase
VEAGGFYEQDNGNFSTIPGLAQVMPFLDTTPSYPRNELMDWDYMSVPQTQAGGRQIHYAQGKTLGGSSAINNLAYHRATRGTYQKWADVVGDRSYQYENIARFFKKSALLHPPDFPKRDAWNATFLYDPTAFDNRARGPLQVSWGQWVDPTITWMAKAIRSLGLPQNLLGLNSGLLAGTGAYVTSTVDPTHAIRSSSRTSYMEKIGVPSGLQVYHHTRATEILFRAKRATGVQVTTEVSSYVLSARREVVLSAGVFGSPHLLMVSGIGPSATLKKYRIPIVSNLEGVGQNLWDQIFFQVINAVTTPSGPQQVALNPRKAEQQYHKQRWGPLSSISAYIAFEKIPSSFRERFSRTTKAALSWFPHDWPEVEYIAAAAPGPNGTSLGVLGGCITAPLSRGSVTIQGPDLSTPPVIDLGWFTHEADGEVAVAAVKRLRQAWKGIKNIAVGPELVPGEAVRTNAQILEFIKNSATQIWHAGATCAMGRKGDSKAVVDSKAKVFGVGGLRVVDASAFPYTVPGHPQATVYMLAEKIAADITGDKS